MATFRAIFGVSLTMSLLTTTAMAQDIAGSLKPGKAEMQSAGVMTFGANGVLFVGDSLGAAIYAIDTADRTPSNSPSMSVTGLGDKVAGLLGTAADQILINDVKINPISHNAYLSVSRGRGPDAVAAIVRVEPSGKLSAVSLDNVRHARVALPNPGANAGDGRRNARLQSITDMKITGGRLFVAGLSNEEFASTLRSIPLPFPTAIDGGTSVEIWHGNHNRFETNAPIRVFTPYEIDGRQNILAAYTCTPLVRFDVAALKPGTKVMGTTIAELGNGNNPLDIVVYTKDGRPHFLMSNDRRGVMKMSADKLGAIAPITTGVAGTAGLAYETVSMLANVVQLDKFSESMAVVLQNNGGSLDLRTTGFP